MVERIPSTYTEKPTPRGGLIASPDSSHVTVMGSTKPLGVRENFQKNPVVDFSKSLDTKTKKAITGELRRQYLALQQDLNKTKKENGFIGKSWDWIKNTTGWGQGSDKTQKDLDALKGQINELEKHPENLGKAYKNITGKDLNAKELERFKKGEIALKAKETVDSYKEGQKASVETVADLTAGIVSFGAYTVAALGLAAAPFTGGASLVITAGAVAVATGAGAAIKMGIKYADTTSGGREYDSAGYDAITGGVNGLLAPITAGIGGAVSKTLAARFGLQVVKEGAEVVAEQGVKEVAVQTVKTGGKSLIEFGNKYTGGNLFTRGLTYTAESVTIGATSGAPDAYVRNGLTTGHWFDENAAVATGQGLMSGALTGLLMDGGFRVAGKAGKKISGFLFKGKTEVVADATASAVEHNAPKIVEPNPHESIIHNETHITEAELHNEIELPKIRNEQDLENHLKTLKNEDGSSRFDSDDINEIVEHGHPHTFSLIETMTKLKNKNGSPEFTNRDITYLSYQTKYLPKKSIELLEKFIQLKDKNGDRLPYDRIYSHIKSYTYAQIEPPQFKLDLAKKLIKLDFTSFGIMDIVRVTDTPEQFQLAIKSISLTDNNGNARLASYEIKKILSNWKPEYQAVKLENLSTDEKLAFFYITAHAQELLRPDFNVKNLSVKEKILLFRELSGLKTADGLKFDGETLPIFNLLREHGSIQNLSQYVMSSLRESVKPIPVSQKSIGTMFERFANIKNTLGRADLDKYVNGLPLQYSRQQFISDFKTSIAGLNKDEQLAVTKYFEFEFGGENGSDIIKFPRNNEMKPNYSDKVNQAIEKIRNNVINFTTKNQVIIPDNPELAKTLNSIIEALPEFTSIIGKKQHGTHKYSVDVHILKVLQESINSPEFEKLSQNDQTILKLSALLHDISKAEGIVDEGLMGEGHAVESALYTRNIIEKLNLPSDMRERIFNLVENHHWLGDLAQNKLTSEEVAVLFRNPEDFSIAKILADADLKGVSPEFYQAHKSALSSDKINEVERTLEKIYSSGIPIFQTKLPFNQDKLPMVELNGHHYKVIDLTHSDVNLETIGFAQGTSKQNIRFMTHFMGNNDTNSPQTLWTLSDDANRGCLSTSILSLENKRTYQYRADGIIVETPNTNLAQAYNHNIGSGYEKDFNEFSSLILRGDSVGRKYIPEQIKQYLGLNDSEYAEFFRKIANVKDLSEIQDINIDGKILKANVIADALSKSRDSLFTDIETHNEIVMYNPKMKAFICKRNSLSEVPQHILDFAQKHDLPIVLFGEN